VQANAGDDANSRRRAIKECGRMPVPLLFDSPEDSPKPQYATNKEKCTSQPGIRGRAGDATLILRIPARQNCGRIT
jgi:hypothetical protein